MRLLTRLSDNLLGRLVPKAAVRASCEPDVSCGVCQYDHTKWCCSWHQDCVKTCGWRSC